MGQLETDKMIILICGLPGSGKTYFAEHLAEELGAVHISSDRVRDDIDRKGQYSQHSKDPVYEEMRRRMTEQIQHNQVVIVDATFFSRQVRQPFYKAARSSDAELFLIEIAASNNVIRQRVNRTREESEADYDVYLKLKNSFEPVEIPHLTLSSDDEDVRRMMDQAMDYLGIQQT